MKKHAKLYITIAVILLLAVGIYALFRGDTKRMNAAAGSGNPAMEFDNIDLKEDKDGKPVWRFKAKHVTMSQDKNIIDGLVLYAKNLTYDGKTQILSTDQFFTAEKDNRVLTGDSFTGDRVLQQLTAKGHAKLADKEDAK